MANRFLDIGLDEQVIEERFLLFGGLARYCFNLDAVAKNSYEEGDMCNCEKSAKYLQIYGALNYVGTWSRPDVCYGMSLLCQYIKSLTTDAYEALLKMLNYVATTKGHTLKMGNLSTDELKVFTDADRAKDTNDRKSRTGMLLMYNSSPIQWKSKKHSRGRISCRGHWC